MGVVTGAGRGAGAVRAAGALAATVAGCAGRAAGKGPRGGWEGKGNVIGDSVYRAEAERKEVAAQVEVLDPVMEDSTGQAERPVDMWLASSLDMVVRC